MVYLPALSGGKATLSDIFKAYPATAVPLIEACEAILRGPSPLSPQQRELAAAYVSTLNQCGHCSGTHTGATEYLGTPKGLVRRLIDDFEGADLDPKMKAALVYARKLTLTPSEITPADADALFRAGWEEQALHDIVSVCALFNFFNRYVTGLGLETPPDVAAERGKMLVDVGYEGMIEGLKLREMVAAASKAAAAE